ARTLTMTGSAATIQRSGTAWSLGGTGSFTFNAPTTLTFTDASAATKTIIFSSLSGFSFTYNAVTFTGGGGSTGTFTLQGPLASFTTGTFGANQTYLLGTSGDPPTFTTVAINGASGNTVTFKSSSAGTLRTLTIKTSGTAAYTTF